MSNIRPIGDPSLATAMVATFQSIDAARSAPSGISEPRWRILQCIAKAAPNVPSPGELRMCSGLNKAALAEHVQALRWKGLIEMDGYRLSPSAAAMVGIEHPYPPQDAKGMMFAERKPIRPVRAREMSAFARKLAEAVSLLAGEEKELPLADIGPLRDAQPTIFGLDISSQPDVSIKAAITFGTDGKIAKIETLLPLTPADVPACMRPDCTPPAEPVPAPKARRETNKPNKHGRGRSAVDRPLQGAERCERVAPDRISGVGPDVTQVRILPPANPSPPKFTSWIEQRAARIAGAIAFLKSQAILVSVVDRDADIRTYRVSGKKYALLAEEVIEIAIAKGWAE